METLSLTRRHLLRTLSAASAMAAMPSVAGAQSKTQIETVAFNNVGLLVSDPKRSIEFYQRIFGMPIQAQSPNGATCLRVGAGPHFLAISKAVNTKPRINRLGMTVKDFDADKMAKILKDGGVDSARVVKRMTSEGGAVGGTPELLFNDPDGLLIQLQHTDYAGGAGAHGDVVMNPSAGSKAVVPVTTYNHLTMRVSDIPRTVNFYQKHFGMFLQVKNTLVNAPDLGIGPDGARPFHQCIGVTGSATMPPELNHFCFGLEKFDHNQVLKALDDAGIKSGPDAKGPMTARLALLKSIKDGGPALGGPPGGTPEVFVADPDGLMIQIQDVSFCGEANADKGGVCPN